MIVKKRINRVRIVLRSQNAADITHIGNAGKLLDFAVTSAVVFRYLNQTVVRSDIN